jgi:hypothetical protein
MVVDSVTNTKKATVLATLGFKFREGGAIFIQYDDERPKSTGGTAHFLFESSIGNDVQKALRVYDVGTADADLETFIESWQGRSTEVDAFIKELVPAIRDALIVNGRKFLDNYTVMVKGLKEDIKKYVKTGGTPVFDKQGNVVAYEDFTIKGLKS